MIIKLNDAMCTYPLIGSASMDEFFTPAEIEGKIIEVDLLDTTVASFCIIFDSALMNQ